MQPTHRRTLVITLIMGVSLIFLASLAFLYRTQIAGLEQVAIPRCYVGVQGTAASITVVGLNAEIMCQQFVQDSYHPCDNKPSCIPIILYKMSNEPTQPEVCEGDYKGVHMIVRDEGIFKIIGNLLCSSFFPSK